MLSTHCMKGSVSFIKSSISILPCTLDWAQTGKNTLARQENWQQWSQHLLWKWHPSFWITLTALLYGGEGEGGVLLRKGMSCHYSKLVVNEFLLINGDEAIGQRDNAGGRWTIGPGVSNCSISEQITVWCFSICHSQTCFVGLFFLKIPRHHQKPSRHLSEKIAFDKAKEWGEKLGFELSPISRRVCHSANEQSGAARLYAYQMGESTTFQGGDEKPFAIER